MSEFHQAQKALAALKQKFPDGVPDVAALSEEQRVWLTLKLQTIAEEAGGQRVFLELQKIRNRLVHATEDIPNQELQKMVSFVFNNIEHIENCIQRHKGKE